MLEQVGFFKKPSMAVYHRTRDNNFQPFVSQMCTILRKNIWSYWTVLMAWLKLITWRHWQFHLALLNRITWRYWTVLPGVTGPYHLTLLDSFTWPYWTASPDVTGQFHLALLDRITWRYWAVSLVMTEPIGQFPLAILKPIYLTLQDSNRAVQYATANSLICDWSQSTWKISQWHRKISWSIYSK